MTKRTLLLVLGIVVLVVGGYYLYSELQLSQKKPISASIPPTKNSIRVPVDIKSEKIQYFSDIPISFRNPRTSVIVSLRGTTQEARNPGSNLYLNENKIGEIEGRGILSPSFSPDNKYFGFIATGICGANCSTFDVYVLNLLNNKLFFVNPPKDERNFEEKSHLGYVVNPYIESYSWSGDTVKVTFFFVGIDGQNNKSYRISPKEVWSYDLNTGQYIFLETLPE